MRQKELTKGAYGLTSDDTKALRCAMRDAVAQFGEKAVTSALGASSLTNVFHEIDVNMKRTDFGKILNTVKKMTKKPKGNKYAQFSKVPG